MNSSRPSLLSIGEEAIKKNSTAGEVAVQKEKKAKKLAAPVELGTLNEVRFDSSLFLGKEGEVGNANLSGHKISVVDADGHSVDNRNALWQKGRSTVLQIASSSSSQVSEKLKLNAQQMKELQGALKSGKSARVKIPAAASGSKAEISSYYVEFSPLPRPPRDNVQEKMLQQYRGSHSNLPPRKSSSRVSFKTKEEVEKEQNQIELNAVRALTGGDTFTKLYRVRLSPEEVKKEEVAGIVRMDEKMRANYRVYVRGGKLYTASSAGQMMFKTEKRVNQLGAKITSGKAIFVVSREGKIYVAEESSTNSIKHFSFLSGDDVAMAGTLEFDEDGQITGISKRSGHYLPDDEGLDLIRNYFKQLGVPMEKMRSIPLKDA